MPTLTHSKSSKAESETLNRLCSLPRLHPNAGKLLSINSEDEKSLKAFEEVFASDPSLAADLLRAANSVEFGLRARVTSVQFALMVSGVDRTRSLAATITMGKYGRSLGGGADGRSIWMHSLATAVVAEEIGACLGIRLTHQYTAGLMHDLGRLGLLSMAGREYSEILAKDYTDIDEANALEIKLFGMTHAHAGAFLAQTWLFPEILCDCVREHHDPARQDDHEELRITQLACFLACELGYPELQHCEPPDTDQQLLLKVRAQPELDPERLTALIRQRIEFF